VLEVLGDPVEVGTEPVAELADVGPQRGVQVVLCGVDRGGDLGGQGLGVHDGPTWPEPAQLGCEAQRAHAAVCGFDVSPASLRQSGGEVAALGAGLDAGRIAGDASIWGGDEEGAAFGAAYREVADTARAALASVVEELASIGDRWAAMAQSYEHTDEASGEAFGRILEG
jgi:uncharacterized protein YukE